MTKEQAIEVLNTYYRGEDNDDREFCSAIDMAIKALEQQPSDETIKYLECNNKGDLQGCLEFRELAEELEKLEQIEQIYGQWAETGDNADCWAFNEIGKVLEQK